MLEKYRHYFNIDPDYISVVNADTIRKNPKVWKKYTPHKTFIELINSTIKVLERKDKLSLWCEGAYGTGKSHAVLTLKHLIDANESDTEEYFNRYNLDHDLFNRFMAVKNEGKILTVHRYGSSNIYGDNSLIFAIQESIEHALVEAGIETNGNSLKGATIKWLSDEDNRNYFNSLVTGKYSNVFGGDTVDDIISKLENYSDAALAKLMDKIFNVAQERQIKALSMSVTDLTEWIRKDVIEANGLKAVLFIWDEFTEYFKNNSRNLTGFQQICELSETEPFYFIIVTHVSSGLFHEKDQDFIKLNGRFVSPHCMISLPEDVAFHLMGAALEKNQDASVMADWANTLDELIDRTKESRKYVMQAFKIPENDMKGILPLHPYAALLLQHISSAFDSNQRSMFDFIKNDRGDEIKGFQWFIDNRGPMDEDGNPFLTIDMLWDFFYEKGKDYLAHGIRSILDYYNSQSNSMLDDDDKRVLKTVLLMQAISLNAGDSVNLFVPSAKNIDLAFEGTDLENGAAGRIANGLIAKKVLFSKPLGGDKFQFCAYNHEDDIDTSGFEKQIDSKSTTSLVSEEISDKLCVSDAVALKAALKLRYELRSVSSSDFDSTIKQLRNQEENFGNKIAAVVCFAKDETESIVIKKKIRTAVDDGSYHMVFIDATLTPFGADGFSQYKREMAKSMAYQGKDGTLANQYSKNAKEYLKKWKDRISEGEFLVYDTDRPNGERAVTVDALYEMLSEINKAKYPCCLEASYNVIDNMYNQQPLGQGADCGINQKTTGTYSAPNPAKKLETALEGAWKVDRYWEEKPGLLISKIKIAVDNLISAKHKTDSPISFREIYDFLKAAPYGFMPCNLTAFILGFVLKEYCNGSYHWRDSKTDEILDTVHLKEAIEEVIKLDTTPNPRYTDKYIVALGEKEMAFNTLTAEAFDISANLCTSIPNTRERVRGRMKEYTFPIWAIKSVLPGENLQTDADVIAKLLDLYCGIANSNNMGGGKSETDIANEIGELALVNKNAGSDLKKHLNKDKCTAGMTAYVDTYKGGELRKLADEIGDGGQYINVLRSKFTAESANWVWSTETAEKKIDETIVEYTIIAESNRIIARNTTFDSTVKEWCDKCNYIRISYPASKAYLDDIGPFLELLYIMKKSGTILESQKALFLEQLRTHGEAFRAFSENQLDLFRRVCVFYIADLSDDEVADFFSTLPTGLFTYEKNEYNNLINDKATAFRAELGSTKLKKLWKEKTNSESPVEWSRKHSMPILAIFPKSDEVEKARIAFSTISKAHPDSDAIETATAYLNGATFFNVLSDDAALDRIFLETIIKDYAVLLSDVNEVKEYLVTHVAAEPYDWCLGHREVDEKIEQMAEAKYSQNGYKRALAKIDAMPIEDVKKYLKELIENDMKVGIEIIRNN